MEIELKKKYTLFEKVKPLLFLEYSHSSLHKICKIRHCISRDRIKAHHISLITSAVTFMLRCSKSTCRRELIQWDNRSSQFTRNTRLLFRMIIPGPELPRDRSSYYMANLPALRLNHDLKTGLETYLPGFKIASIHDLLLESSLITACANTCQNQTTKAKMTL